MGGGQRIGKGARDEIGGFGRNQIKKQKHV